MLTVIFPPGPTHPLPIFCSEIVPKLTVTETKKLCFALLFFGGRTPALPQACCVHGFPSTVLGVQVQGDTKDNLTFTAWAIQVACAPEYRVGGGCIWGHAGGCQVVWLLSLGPPSCPRATQRYLEVLLCEAEQDAQGPSHRSCWTS